jgi:sialic acid synthase SpsE
MDYYEKAMLLERFIRFYIPKGWKESIKSCAVVPHISMFTYTAIKSCYKYNVNYYIKDSMELNKPYIIEAIQAYFKQLNLSEVN